MLGKCYDMNKLLYHTKYFDGLVQESCNPIANALELCLSCNNPSILCKYLFMSESL